MFFAAVEDWPHALGGAGVMVEKVFDSREVNGLLHLPILQIIVARIANAEIIQADLLAPMNFICFYRASAAKPDVVAPAVGIVGRHVGMDFVAIELIRWPAGGNATVNWHHEG